MALNALVAAHTGIPIAFITGDDVTIAEAECLASPPHGVAVKRDVSRTAAESLRCGAASARARGWR